MKIESHHEVIIDSGILIKYIQAYFQNLSFEYSPLHYKGSHWEVFLIPLPENSNATISSIYIPRTEIHFIGEKNIVEKMVTAYRLEFLSAGG